MTITAYDLRSYVYTHVDSARSCPVPVRVQGGDYAYDGWLVGIALKRSGVMRATVEDANGRLFIHNTEQLTLREEPTMTDKETTNAQEEMVVRIS